MVNYIIATLVTLGVCIFFIVTKVIMQNEEINKKIQKLQNYANIVYKYEYVSEKSNQRFLEKIHNLDGNMLSEYTHIGSILSIDYIIYAIIFTPCILSDRISSNAYSGLSIFYIILDMYLITCLLIDKYHNKAIMFDKLLNKIDSISRYKIRFLDMNYINYTFDFSKQDLKLCKLIDNLEEYRHKMLKDSYQQLATAKINDALNRSVYQNKVAWLNKIFSNETFLEHLSENYKKHDKKAVDMLNQIEDTYNSVIDYLDKLYMETQKIVKMQEKKIDIQNKQEFNKELNYYTNMRKVIDE